MAQDIYLQIDGIKGESADSEHKDWIEVLAYSHSIAPLTSAFAESGHGADPGSGQNSGHADRRNDFTVTKKLDMASPKLYELCSSGKHIKTVTIELIRASGDKRVKYMSIEMDQVVISQVESGSQVMQDASGLPTERVSFQYEKILWTYTSIRADGSKGGNVTGGWDLSTNKAI